MRVVTDAVFRAVADPTRRAILDRLAGSAHSVKELTAGFDMSQPAISQHLRELRAAGLVDSERVGAENRYRLIADPLREVYAWSAQYKRFFDPSGHAWQLSSVSVAADLRLARKGVKRTQRHGS